MRRSGPSSASGYQPFALQQRWRMQSEGSELDLFSWDLHLSSARGMVLVSGCSSFPFLSWNFGNKIRFFDTLSRKCFE
jgi:hypothetical protein